MTRLRYIFDDGKFVELVFAFQVHYPRLLDSVKSSSRLGFSWNQCIVNQVKDKKSYQQVGKILKYGDSSRVTKDICFDVYGYHCLI